METIKIKIDAISQTLIEFHAYEIRILYVSELMTIYNIL